MASWYLDRVRSRDDARRFAQAQRQRGFADGYSGRPAVSVQADYQTGWTRGTEARRDELLNDLDDDGA